LQVNKELNLVIPIEHDDGTIAYVYATPISVSVFERYYMVFAKAFNTIYSGGLGIMSGPRVAAMIMKDAAKELGIWDGPEGVERGLIQESRRLTSVIVLTEKGWEPVPLHEAIAKGSLDERDVAEVENAIAFFTVASHMHRKADRRGILESALKLWGGRLESLSYTEFCASLSTSTTVAISPPKETIPALQVPS
jgi:hypothetical protein